MTGRQASKHASFLDAGSKIEADALSYNAM